MDYKEVEETVQKLAGTYLKDIVGVILCTVESYDTTALTCDCTPVNDYSVSDIPGVKLSASGVSDGFIVFPTVGSNVYVGVSTRNSYFLLMYSDIDKIQVTIPNGSGGWTKFFVSSTGIQMNDGSYGGLIEVGNLVTKLNNEVSQLQTELGKIATAIGSLGGSYVPGTITVFNRADFENTLITHGK